MSLNGAYDSAVDMPSFDHAPSGKRALLDDDYGSESKGFRSDDDDVKKPYDHSKPPTFPPLCFVPRWYFIAITVIFITAVALLCTVFKDNVLRPFVNAIGRGDDDEVKFFLELVSVPVISIVFTYCHIWAALWMTFYPLKYVGCLQIPGTNTGLGWQGIIPNKAIKMAKKAVKLMTEQLLDVEEVFSRLDPVMIAKEMEAVMPSLMSGMIEGMALKYAPDVWLKLPQNVKDELVKKATEDSPEVIQNMFEDVRKNIKQCFDVEHMVVDSLTRDKDLLNQIFIRCGHAELSFIRNAGAWMGGLFGLLQAIVYVFYDAHWVLPTVGFVVGTFTNWLALKMIFSPVQPVKCCGPSCCCREGCYMQGLFLKRQKQVSAEYGRTIAKEVLNAKNIIAAIISGPSTNTLFAIMYKHVKASMDKFAGGSHAQTLMAMTIGEEEYAKVKGEAVDAMMEALPACLAHLESYSDRALDVENTLRVKMSALSPEAFEGLLHPVFQEDEWKLVLMGGVLGVVIGLLQTYTINNPDNGM